MTTDAPSSRALLEALPFPAFIVREDLTIVDVNESARGFTKDADAGAVSKLCGDALHCVHAMMSEEGCGTTPACADCVVRGAVGDVMGGKQVERRRSVLRLTEGSSRRDVHVVVTASKLDVATGRAALLIIEDITEWIELEGIVPICAECKKIRSDVEYWEQVESYLSKRTRLEFSHGLCPSCAADLIAKYEL